jgi:hypothetical protein
VLREKKASEVKALFARKRSGERGFNTTLSTKIFRDEDEDAFVPKVFVKSLLL